MSHKWIATRERCFQLRLTHPLSESKHCKAAVLNTRAAGEKVQRHGEIGHQGKQEAQAWRVETNMVCWSLAIKGFKCKFKQAKEEHVDVSAVAPLPASGKAEAYCMCWRQESRDSEAIEKEIAVAEVTKICREGGGFLAKSRQLHT